MAENEKEMKSQIVYVVPLEIVLGHIELIKQSMLNNAQPLEIEAKNDIKQ